MRNTMTIGQHLAKKLNVRTQFFAENMNSCLDELRTEIGVVKCQG